MQISGNEFFTNNYLNKGNIDVNKSIESVKQVDNVSPDRTRPNSGNNEGASIKISHEGNRAGRISERLSSSNLNTTDFSTGKTENNTTKTDTASSANGNSVLNQYRFFVQSTQYEGSDGVVKRIFR